MTPCQVAVYHGLGHVERRWRAARWQAEGNPDQGGLAAGRKGLITNVASGPELKLPSRPGRQVRAWQLLSAPLRSAPPTPQPG